MMGSGGPIRPPPYAAHQIGQTPQSDPGWYGRRSNRRRRLKGLIARELVMLKRGCRGPLILSPKSWLPKAARLTLPLAVNAAGKPLGMIVDLSAVSMLQSNGI
jgi:hypothetical protein